MTKNKSITSIFGIDKQKEAIERAKHNLKNLKVFVITGDAEDLPYHNNSFDSIHCGQTLEHVRDDDKVVSEIFRATRKRAIFSVPIHGGLSAQHLREYDDKSIKDLVGKYFTIVSTKLFTGKHNRLVIIAEK